MGRKKDFSSYMSDSYDSSVPRRAIITGGIATAATAAFMLRKEFSFDVSGLLRTGRERPSDITIDQFEEAERISSSIARFTKNPIYILRANPAYISEVLKEADWASQQLSIRKEFVVAQWFHESGAYFGFSPTMRSRNNLGGIGSEYNLKTYPNLHEFAADYVRILKNDGVQGGEDFWTLIDKLADKTYFTAGRTQYGVGVLSNLERLRPVGENYSHYYDDSTKRSFFGIRF